MRVVVGMSGGVDSSLAAALLADAGYEVIGVTMGLLPCPDESALESARQVCKGLSIRHEFVERVDAFDAEVISAFAAEYAAGRTPNPCVVCNERFKFAGLLAIADELGAQVVATGHYARIEQDRHGASWLGRGADRAKDQSYFLYRLSPEVLARVLFPLGGLTKALVREAAAALGLESARRPDSQEVCFVADGCHADLVAERFPETSSRGVVVDRDGVALGSHRGLAHYTVGQRKGLGIAAPEALYVIALDVEANRLVVGPRDALEVTEIEADDVVWRGGPDAIPVQVQTRYRMDPVDAGARMAGERLIVSTALPVTGVAPGQAVVCYSDDRVIGGGPVRCTR